MLLSGKPTPLASGSSVLLENETCRPRSGTLTSTTASLGRTVPSTPGSPDLITTL